MIIKRYLTKEIASTLLVVTAVVMLIFISNQFVRYLNWVAAGKYAYPVVLRLMLVQIPLLLGLLLPLGLYLGILLSFGRLYVDSEMVVLAACGLSQRRVWRFILVPTCVVAGIVALFMLCVNPAIMAYKEKLLLSGGTESILQTIFPGRFETMDDGRTIYYIERLGRDRQKAHGIFMATLPNDHPKDPDKSRYWQYLSADYADQYYDTNIKASFLVMHNGYRYFGEPGKKDFRLIKFARYGIRLAQAPIDVMREADAVSTLKLFGFRKHAEAMAELQWRLALPISTVLLAFLAVPLAKVNPRSGRFIALLPAILIYVIYANLMFLGRSWIEQGSLSPHLGLWAIHLCLFLVGLLCWNMRFGWRELRVWR